MNTNIRNAKLSSHVFDCGLSGFKSDADAVGYFLCEFCPDAPSQVLGVRNDFEVIGVDALPVSTQVVNDKPGWDWPKALLVELSMGCFGPAISVLELTVTTGRDASLPVPATGFLVHDVFEGGEPQVVAGQIADELATNDSFFSGCAIRSRDWLSTPAHAESGWIGSWTGSTQFTIPVLDLAGSATSSIATTDGLTAVNTSSSTIQGHSADLLSRSVGATPTAVDAARGHFYV